MRKQVRYIAQSEAQSALNPDPRCARLRMVSQTFGAVFLPRLSGLFD
jgi:hypothetical protein